MEIVLSGLARDKCHIYMDDVLVFGKTMQEHNQNLVSVLTRIRRAELRLKPKKCKFAQTSVEYLGHVVSAAGVQTDPKKIQAVRQYPVPVDVKALRSFLGLASYYRRFVPSFAKVAGPLHALTKKDVPYLWSPQCQNAFEQIRELLTTTPILCYPNFKRPFILETDASGCGLGAVLAQEQDDKQVRPISYASRSLQKHERNYGITELEGLGVVWAVKHFRTYLYGHQCIVYTDHEALKSLLNTPQPSGKLARWGMALQEMDLTIVHRSGKKNGNADALSRFSLPTSSDENLTCGVVATVTEESVAQEDLASQHKSDMGLAAIIYYIESGVLPEDEALARKVVLSSPLYTVSPLLTGEGCHTSGGTTTYILPTAVSRSTCREFWCPPR
jgi:hypothetical protein